MFGQVAARLMADKPFFVSQMFYPFSGGQLNLINFYCKGIPGRRTSLSLAVGNNVVPTSPKSFQVDDVSVELTHFVQPPFQCPSLVS